MKQIAFIFLLFSINFCGISQSRYISQHAKKIVFTRDGGKCQCCFSTVDLEFDHIIPFSCGGSSDASNIQLLCQPCNRSKSNSCTCKIHHKKVGNHCCDHENTVIHSAHSSASTAHAIQCSGTTKKGYRCRNKTNNANGRCYLHQ